MEIYKITNTVNSKVYVGKTTKTAQERWKTHCASAFSENSQHYIHRAMRKYGAAVFVVSTLASADSLDELNALEIAFIQQLDSMNKGYNMTRGGDAGWEYINRVLGPTLKRFKDHKHSEATRAQMSASHQGLQAGSKHGMFGRKMTMEQRLAHAARIKAVRATRPWSTRHKNQVPQIV